MQNSTDSFVLFCTMQVEKMHTYSGIVYILKSCTPRNFLNDHNMQSDISYLNISYGMLNRISMKMK